MTKHLPDWLRQEQTAEHEVQRKLAAEKSRAAAEMSARLANLHMPEDIRSRAKSWGMEAWAEVLWNNAFQAGYREAMRDRPRTEGESDG